MLFLLYFIAGLAAWSPPSFAQRQEIVGPPPPTDTTLNANGVTSGVDMIGETNTGTLVVPAGSNIFTNNTSLTSNLPAVSTSATSTGNVTFLGSSTVYGAIGMTEPVGPYLLDLSGGANGATVVFLGPVNVTNTFVTGTGTLNYSNAGGTIVQNATPGGLVFQGNGTVIVAAGTYLDAAAGITTTAADAGNLVLNAGSIVQGAVGDGNGMSSVTVDGGSATTGVSAYIGPTLATGGTAETDAVNVYTLRLNTNTLYISGALTIANSTASGLIYTTLASPTLYGNIRPTGTLNLGALLTVDVTVPASAIIPVGTVFDIVKTNGSQTGTPNIPVTVVDLTTPNSKFTGLDFGAGLIEITNQQAFLGPIPITPPPGSPPGTPPAAPAGLPPGVPNPIVPSAPDLAAPLVTFQTTRQFENLWLAHLDEVMCGQVSQPQQPGTPQPASCQRNEPHSGWWAKGFGYFGNQNAEDGFTGYNSTTLGTMIGFDTPIAAMAFGGETRVGFGIGYAYTTIDGKTVSANTDSNTYEATAYIAHEQGPWFVDGDLSFGWNDYSESRTVLVPNVLNSTASGNYSGQTYTAFATTGYHFYTQGFTLTPLASLQYTHMDLGSYTETGAAPLNLSVNSQSYDFLESSLGAMAARPFGFDYGTYVPEAHFKWFHELVNPRLQNNWTALAFTGSETFTTQGPKTGADTFDGGVGLTFLSCSCTAMTWSLEAVYDFFWRTDSYTANQFMIRFTAHF